MFFSTLLCLATSFYYVQIKSHMEGRFDFLDFLWAIPVKYASTKTNTGYCIGFELSSCELSTAGWRKNVFTQAVTGVPLHKISMFYNFLYHLSHHTRHFLFIMNRGRESTLYEITSGVQSLSAKSEYSGVKEHRAYGSRGIRRHSNSDRDTATQNYREGEWSNESV